MDHGYIDGHKVADRYLDHALKAEEREEFESHLVDCQECTDRVLLAEMFHARNGHSKPQPAAELLTIPPEIPRRARFVAQFRPWQLLLLFLVTTVLTLAIPTMYFLWQLHLAAKAR